MGTYSKIKAISVSLVSLISLFVFCGWVFKVESLVAPFSTPMHFNTAVCLLLLTLCLQFELPKKRPALFHLLSAFTSALSGLTIVEYLFDINIGIDTLFINSFISIPGQPLGRMSMNTATALFFLALASWGLSTIKNKKAALFCSVGSFFTFAICIAALAGHLANIREIYAWSGYAPMAVHSCICLLILSSIAITEVIFVARASKILDNIVMLFVPLLIGVIISFILWQGSISYETKLLQKRVETDAENRRLLIQTDINTDISLLHAVAGLFHSSDYVSEKEFNTFTLPLISRHPSFVAVDWAPRVENKDREKIEASIGQFKQQGANGGLVKRDSSPIYYPVTYSASLFQVLSPLGYDHYSDLNRLRAMDNSAQSADAIATEPLVLFRMRAEANRVEDFLVVVPVYHSKIDKRGITSGLDKRIKGYVIGIFKTSILLDNALKILPKSMLNSRIYFERGDGSESIMLDYSSEGEVAATYTKRLEISVAGRTWAIESSPTKLYLSSVSSKLSLFVIFFCLGLTFLSIAYLYSILKKGEELRVAKEAALEGTKAKASFLANMSHEIRTPLTGIIGFSEELLDEGLSLNERTEYTRIVLTASQHLLQLVNDILDFSKIEAGKLSVTNEDFELLPVIESVESILRSKAAEKGLVFSLVKHYPLPKTIHSDALRVKQILMNLIGNAIKFTEKGAVKMVVSYDGAELQFAISDTGIGMSEEQLAKTFQVFSQGDASTTKRFGGTGLGLAISKDLAKLLGGDIKVSSREHIGSTFTFYIALRVAEGAEWLLEDGLEEGGLSTLSAENSPFFDGYVLLAEDGLDNQRLIRKLLEKVGITVDVTPNGKVALERSQSRRYDLILMDMQMPVMDGYTATEQIRKNSNNTPVIACTADVSEESRKRCVAVGCTEVLHKPFTQAALINVLKKFIPASKTNIIELTEEDFGQTGLTPHVMKIEFPELQEKFITKIDLKINELEAALKDGRIEELSRLAHTLRGSFGLYGLPTLSDLAAEIEENSKVGRVEGVPGLLKSMRGIGVEINGGLV